MPDRTPSVLAALRAAIASSSLALLALAAPTRTAAAQAWFAPSFQPPTLSNRDYTAGLTANAGTSAIFQWREGIDPRSNFGLEGGLVDTEGNGGTKLLLGGQYAYQLARATADQPLDLLLTAGAGMAVGDGPDLFRIPVGVSVGHRFPLQGALAITPYVHPRLSLDFYSGAGDADGSDLAIDFDIGANFEITPQMALRGSLILSGGRASDDVGFGIGLTITPAPLRR